MLKVEKGVIGNKQLASMEFTEEDRKVIIIIAERKPKFYATNGCGLNLSEMLQGKLVFPCTNIEFEYILEAVKQFNEEYFPTKDWESEYTKLKAMYNNDLKGYGDITDKYNNLLSEHMSLKTKLKNILENNK